MAKLIKSTVVQEAVGTIKPYGNATAPSGWLNCDGTAVSRTTYAGLFAIIGTTYGVGDNSTTFNVPDIRGATPAGAGTSTGYTANETITLGAKGNDSMQGHFHGSTDGILGNGAGSSNFIGGTFYRIVSITGPTSDGTNGTPRTGTVTKGKTVGVNYVIKY